MFKDRAKLHSTIEKGLSLQKKYKNKMNCPGSWYELFQPLKDERLAKDDDYKIKNKQRLAQNANEALPVYCIKLLKRLGRHGQNYTNYNLH